MEKCPFCSFEKVALHSAECSVLKQLRADAHALAIRYGYDAVSMLREKYPGFWFYVQSCAGGPITWSIVVRKDDEFQAIWASPKACGNLI